VFQARQIRWKTSLPRVLVTRPFGPTMVAVNLVATVVGLTKRPDQTAFTLQSDVHVREVWNATRGPRTRPARSYGTAGHGPPGLLTKTPLKFPAASTLKTFSSVPR
jgi:hypothetical protein